MRRKLKDQTFHDSKISQALAASCSPLHASNHQNDTGGVTPGTIASTISDVLRRLVAPQHLHPLVTCLIDGLRDDLGGRGTGLVLCSLLESRGNEETLTSQTGKTDNAALLLRMIN